MKWLDVLQWTKNNNNNKQMCDTWLKKALSISNICFIVSQVFLYNLGENISSNSYCL